MLFLDDHNKPSVTSGPNQWVKRAKASQKPVLATKLRTSISKSMETNHTESDSEDEWFNPLPAGTSLPDHMELVAMTKQNLPNACLLDAFEIKAKPTKQYSPPHAMAPMEKLSIFSLCHECTSSKICNDECFNELEGLMLYSDEERKSIELSTRDQNANPHWHDYRKGLLTASTFKTVIHTKNMTKCAMGLLSGSRLNEDDLPWHIEFGRKNEPKARDLFFKMHKFEHKGCSLSVPGLYISKEEPFLGASPDGIIKCDKCVQKQRLIEIKCLSSKRNYSPKVALVLLAICTKDTEDNLTMNKTHKYYYQVQGQMGVTGIHECWFIGYTYKGIHKFIVRFDPEIWSHITTQLNRFYQYGFLPVAKEQVNTTFPGDCTGKQL